MQNAEAHKRLIYLIVAAIFPNLHNSHMSMGSATLADDCCGDNCFGSQIFLPITYTFHLITGNRFQRAHSKRPLEPLITAEYLPPIFHS